MRSTTEASRVTSTLLDLRNVPLTEISLPSMNGHDQALARVLPDSPTAPVPVAAFTSAI
jgi:FXSXX-COOH protein